MAVFTITIPTDKVTPLLNAFANKYGYQATVVVNGETVANPVTKAEFAKSKVLEYIKSVYKEQRIAEELAAINASAQATANTDVDTLTIA